MMAKALKGGMKAAGVLISLNLTVDQREIDAPQEEVLSEEDKAVLEVFKPASWTARQGREVKNDYQKRAAGPAEERSGQLHSSHFPDRSPRETLFGHLAHRCNGLAPPGVRRRVHPAVDHHPAPCNLKSIAVSVAFPAWLLGRDPTRKILCVSYAHDLSVSLAFLTRTVMDAPWYKGCYPGARTSQ